MNKILLLILSLTLLSACEKKERTAGSIAYDNKDLVAYEDKTRGVICYRVIGYSGLSCLKLGGSGGN